MTFSFLTGLYLGSLPNLRIVPGKKPSILKIKVEIDGQGRKYFG